MVVLIGYFIPAFSFKSALIPRLRAFYFNQGYFTKVRAKYFRSF